MIRLTNNGSSVYVNPHRITFIETRGGNGVSRTAVWFGNSDTVILVEESAADVSVMVFKEIYDCDTKGNSSDCR